MIPLPARYEFRRSLGQGGMGAVHLVADRERGEDVALKLFTPGPDVDRDEAAFLFKQEFWTTAALSHPHLPAAYDYGTLPDGTPYFTMAAVMGHDLAEAAPMPEAAVRAWLPGIAAALAYLHGRGDVHGDVSPANIRLTPDGSPMLMDLGLLTPSGRVGGPIRGSLAYMAPEAIGRGAIDGRADLYALGAVLYHMLSGHPPFAQTDPLALLRAHMHQAPAPLAQHAPGVSDALADAVHRLLAKDPADRFAHAGELLAFLGLAAPAEVAPGLLSSPLLGRAAVQARLRALAEGTATGALWLVGPEGAGKTRLLAEARATAQLAGMAVFVAEGLGPDAAPYAALAPWLRALAARSAATSRLAPVLARVLPGLGCEPAPALEGAQERARLHAAVLELAESAAEQALWLLDDADRLDAPSVELLRLLQRRESDDTAHAGWRWVMAGQSAPEGAGALDLAPLSPEVLAAIAQAQLGLPTLPAALAERLPVLSGGQPGAAEALIAHWVRTGVLTRDAEGWQVPVPEALRLPEGVAAAQDARFAALDADTRRVGQIAAVLGPQGDLGVLADLAGLDEAAFFGALAALAHAEVLEHSGRSYRFVRPVQAEAIASAWPAAERRHWHGRAAIAMAARLAGVPDAPLDAVLAIARHHLAGETPRAAWAWVVAGAERAMALYAMALAEPLLRDALAVAGWSEPERLALLAPLGYVLRFQGRLDEALALYEGDLLPALRAAGSPALAEHLMTHGILCQLKSRYDDANADLADAIALAEAGDQAPVLVKALITSGRVAHFAGRTDVAIAHMQRAVAAARAADRREVLGTALSFYGYLLASSDAARATEGLGHLDEAIALGEAQGDMVQLHQSLNYQGNVLLAASRLAEAQAAFEGCLAICRRMDTPNELIFAHLNVGAVQLERGETAPAEAHAAAALAMARAQGRQFPESYALAVQGKARVWRGDPAGGMADLAAGLTLARAIANRYVELNILVFMAEALSHLGRFAEAASTIAAARALGAAIRNDEHTAKLARLEAAQAVLTGAPEADAATERLVTGAWPTKQEVPLAHALRWRAEAIATTNPQAAAALAHEAAGVAARAGLPLLEAEAARLRGTLVAGPERTSWLQRSLARARDAGSPVAEALAFAAMGGPMERLEAARLLEAAMAGLSDDERSAFLAVPGRAAVLAEAPTGAEPSADRLHHLTETLAALTTQDGLDGVLRQGLASLVELAGAERGFLLLFEGFKVVQQVFHGMAADESDAYSSSLAYQVLWTGEPIFVEDVQAHAELGQAASVMDLGLRSVLGVPLLEGGEVIGVMLADSRRINTAFAPGDMALALTLARQVAIAIGNARRLDHYRQGYEALKVLHALALAAVVADDAAALMAQVATTVLPLVGGERAILLVGDTLTPRAAFDGAGRALSGADTAVSSSVARWVYDEARPLHLVDAQNAGDFSAQKSVMALGLRTVFAVPVGHLGARLGVLYVDNQRVVEADPAVLKLLSGVGEVVGACLARRGTQA